MFGRERTKPAPATEGNRLPPRTGVIGAEDDFPWVDDVLVIESDGRKLQRPEGDSIVLAPELAVAALTDFGLPVLDLGE
jgi:hypothetical protein